MTLRSLFFSCYWLLAVGSAYGLGPSARALYNVGLAELKEGKLAQANLSFLKAQWRIHQHYQILQRDQRRPHSREVETFDSIHFGVASASLSAALQKGAPLKRLWLLNRGLRALQTMRRHRGRRLVGPARQRFDRYYQRLSQEREKIQSENKPSPPELDSAPFDWKALIEEKGIDPKAQDLFLQSRTLIQEATPILLTDLASLHQQWQHTHSLAKQMDALIKKELPSLTPTSISALFVWTLLIEHEVKLLQNRETSEYNHQHWYQGQKAHQKKTNLEFLLGAVLQPWLASEDPKKFDKSALLIQPMETNTAAFEPSYPAISKVLTRLKTELRYFPSETTSPSFKTLLAGLPRSYAKDFVLKAPPKLDLSQPNQIPLDYYLSHLHWHCLQPTRPLTKGNTLKEPKAALEQWNDTSLAVLGNWEGRRWMARLTRVLWHRHSVRLGNLKSQHDSRLSQQGQMSLDSLLAVKQLDPLVNTLLSQGLSIESQLPEWKPKPPRPEEKTAAPPPKPLSEEGKLAHLKEWLKKPKTDPVAQVYAELLTQILAHSEQLSSGQIATLYSDLVQSQWRLSRLLLILKDLDIDPKPLLQKKSTPVHRLLLELHFSDRLPKKRLEQLEGFRKFIFNDNFPETSKPAWALAKTLCQRSGLSTLPLGNLKETQDALEQLILEERRHQWLTTKAAAFLKNPPPTLTKDEAALFSSQRPLKPFARRRGGVSYLDSLLDKDKGTIAEYTPWHLSFFVPLSVSVPGRKGSLPTRDRPTDPKLDFSKQSPNGLLMLTQGPSPDATLLVPRHTQPQFLIANRKTFPSSRIKKQAGTFTHPLAKQSVTLALPLTGNQLNLGKPRLADIRKHDQAIRSYYLSKGPRLPLTHTKPLQAVLNELKQILKKQRTPQTEFRSAYALREHLLEQSKYSLKHAPDLEGFCTTLVGDCTLGNAYYVYLLNQELRIPARIMHGHLARNGRIPSIGHARAEFWIRDRGWIALDATPSSNSLAETGGTSNSRPSPSQTLLQQALKDYLLTGVENQPPTEFLSKPIDPTELKNFFRSRWPRIEEEDREKFFTSLEFYFKRKYSNLFALYYHIPLKKESAENERFWLSTLFHPRVVQTLRRSSYSNRQKFFEYVEFLFKKYLVREGELGHQKILTVKKRAFDLWDRLEKIGDEIPFKTLGNLLYETDSTFFSAQIDNEKISSKQDLPNLQTIRRTFKAKVKDMIARNLQRYQQTHLSDATYREELFAIDPWILFDDRPDIRPGIEHAVTQLVSAGRSSVDPYYRKTGDRLGWGWNFSMFSNNTVAGQFALQDYPHLLSEAAKGDLYNFLTTSAQHRLTSEQRYALLRAWLLSEDPKVVQLSPQTNGEKINLFAPRASKDSNAVYAVLYTNHTNLFRALKAPDLIQLLYDQGQLIESLRKRKDYGTRYKKALFLRERMIGALQSSALTTPSPHWESIAIELAKDLPPDMEQGVEPSQLDQVIQDVKKGFTEAKPASFKLLGREGVSTPWADVYKKSLSMYGSYNLSLYNRYSPKLESPPLYTGFEELLGSDSPLFIHHFFYLIAYPNPYQDFEKVLKLALSSQYYQNHPNIFAQLYLIALRNGENKPAIRALPLLVDTFDELRWFRSPSKINPISKGPGKPYKNAVFQLKLLAHYPQDQKERLAQILRHSPKRFVPIAQTLLALPTAQLLQVAKILGKDVERMVSLFGEETFTIPLRAVHHRFLGLRPSPVKDAFKPINAMEKFPESTLLDHLAQLRRLEQEIKTLSRPQFSKKLAGLKLKTQELFSKAKTYLPYRLPYATDLFSSYLRLTFETSKMGRSIETDFLKKTFIKALSQKERAVLAFAAFKADANFPDGPRTHLRDYLAEALLSLHPPQLEWVLSRFWADPKLTKNSELVTFTCTQTLHPENTAKLKRIAENRHFETNGLKKAKRAVATLFAGFAQSQTLADQLKKRDRRFDREAYYESKIYPHFPDKPFAKNVMRLASQVKKTPHTTKQSKLYLYAAAEGLIGLPLLETISTGPTLAQVPHAAPLLELATIVSSMKQAHRRQFKHPLGTQRRISLYHSPPAFPLRSLQTRLNLLQTNPNLVPLAKAQLDAFENLAGKKPSFPQPILTPLPDY